MLRVFAEKAFFDVFIATLVEMLWKRRDLGMIGGIVPAMDHPVLQRAFPVIRVITLQGKPDVQEASIDEIYPELVHDLLSGSAPYSVYIKRKDNDRGYGVRIVVEVPGRDVEVEVVDNRVMAVDVNAGHIDFAVAGPDRVLAVGRINCHEVQYCSSGKTDNILHEVAGRIINIAKHYRARIVLGKLNTGSYRGWGARKIKGIPHYKLFHILSYKYGNVKRCSEAYTSKIADSTKGMFGYDVHKVSASLFALKILDYDSFSSLKNAILKGVRAHEGGGSPSAGLTLGSEVTPLHQARGLVHDEDAGVARNGGYSAIPGSGGVSPYLESMRNNLPCLQVKIC